MPLLASRVYSTASGYGAYSSVRNRLKVNIVISSNQTNYTLSQSTLPMYSPGLTDIVVTINSGVYISSNSTSIAAFIVSSSWDTQDTITINNNGFIVGRGGNGGAGSGGTSTGTAPQAGSNGSAGGPALQVLRSTTINNTGTIAGGGGGGGGGKGVWTSATDKGSTSYAAASGGGGGGGRTNLINTSGGPVATSFGFTVVTPASSGGTGTNAAVGGGGNGATISGPSTLGSGGAGGGWGAAGVSGTAGAAIWISAGGPYSGGSAGSAVLGNNNITWISTGTRLGALVS